MSTSTHSQAVSIMTISILQILTEIICSCMILTSPVTKKTGNHTMIWMIIGSLTMIMTTIGNLILILTTTGNLITTMTTIGSLTMAMKTTGSLTQIMMTTGDFAMKRRIT